jgi:ribonucleoside-triphosphate reductase
MNELINEYVNQSTWRMKENSNQGFSLSGLKSHIAHNILAKDQSNLLMEGIINPTGGSSNPAKHFDVVIDHIVNYFYISQQEWEGAQAFSNFDTLISPFIYYDNLNYKQVKQGMQRMIYNLSYPLRASFQSVFSNLSFDLKCPKHMKNEPAIIGGLPQERSLSEFQKEMDMLNMAFLEVMLEGDKNGRPHTFPICTYSITPDFDWDSEVTNRLFELTAKFGLPYFMSYIGTNLDPSTVRAMCCRLNMDLNEIIDTSKGGLWNSGINTGSLGVVTINLPLLGYMSKTCDSDLTTFYLRLNTLLDLAKEHLIYKREKINKGFEMGLMPFTPFTKSYLKNFDTFFSTIGVIGMHECCINLFGKPIYECQDFVNEVLLYINKKTKEFTKETGYPWNLEQSPAEGASHKLAIQDKKNYPDIYVSGSPGNYYYTNSSHINVADGLGLGDSLRIQQEFNKHYTGGTLFHIFAGEGAPNKNGVKDLIKNICINTSVPYIAFTKAYAICEKCGMTDDISGICPTCKGESDVYDRVTGYYRPVKSFNKGKYEEFKNRNRFF